jgi:molybdate transport system substrate-binding protein
VNVRLIIAMALLALQPLTARASDVRIYAAGAVQKAVEALIPLYRERTGRVATATFDTVGAQVKRIQDGETPSLAILSVSGLRGLATAGRISADAIKPIGRTGVGLAGDPKRPAPDIATSAALAAALRAAPSIVHADPARGATAGTHFAKVLADLGLAEELKPRITVVPFGGAVAGHVAAGTYAIGVSQASEIVAHPEVRFLGFLPEPHALWTVYAAAPIAPLDDHARAFLDLLLSADGAKALDKIGFVR